MPPDSPIAPTILPSIRSGRPPSTGTAPCRARILRPSPPAASTSCSALVGRLKRAAERALSTAIFTLAACVPSSFSKYTRSPAVSTIAAAIVQLFLRASASAVAAAFLAFSALIDMPYGFGSCANALAAHNVSTLAPARLQTDRRDMAGPPSTGAGALQPSLGVRFARATADPPEPWRRRAPPARTHADAWARLRMSSVRHGRRRCLSALILLHLGVRHRIRRIECELFMTANRLWPIRFEHRIPL